MSREIVFDDIVSKQRVDSPAIKEPKKITAIAKRGVLLKPNHKEKLEELGHRNVDLTQTTEELEREVCEIVDNIMNEHGYRFRRGKLTDLLRTIYRPRRSFNYAENVDLYWFDYTAPMVIISDTIEAVIAPCM